MVRRLTKAKRKEKLGRALNIGRDLMLGARSIVEGHEYIAVTEVYYVTDDDDRARTMRKSFPVTMTKEAFLKQATAPTSLRIPDMAVAGVRYAYRCVFCYAEEFADENNHRELLRAADRIGHTPDCPILLFFSLLKKTHLATIIQEELDQLDLDYDYDRNPTHDDFDFSVDEVLS